MIRTASRSTLPRSRGSRVVSLPVHSALASLMYQLRMRIEVQKRRVPAIHLQGQVYLPAVARSHSSRFWAGKAFTSDTQPVAPASRFQGQVISASEER